MKKISPSRMPTYQSWKRMMDRCYNKKTERYPRYGGRGITVCERWHTYSNFHFDMGERPENMSLDRMNNDGNYEPSNCRWATRKQQMSNTGRSIKVGGVCLAELARRIGLNHHTLKKRLDRGWPESMLLDQKYTRLNPGTSKASINRKKRKLEDAIAKLQELQNGR